MATPIKNPVAHLNPGQLEHLRAASTPIGNRGGITTELDRIEARRDQFTGALATAKRRYDEDAHVPDGLPESTAVEVVTSVEAAMSGVETRLRRDLAIVSARASAIVGQLREASEQPSLTGDDAETLEAAGRLLPPASGTTTRKRSRRFSRCGRS